MVLLSIAINDSGSTYYRQLLPVQALAKAGYPAHVVPYQGTPSSILNGFDTLLISRVHGQSALESIHKAQARGMTVFVDYDDDLLNLPPWNPAHGSHKSEDVIAVLKAADGIVVTNDALAAVYRPYNQNIAVIPNYVDVSSWLRPLSDIRQLTIGLFGSPSHIKDWELIADPMRRIKAEFPDVRFVVAGYKPDYLEPDEFIPWVSLSEYRSVISQFDIGLCPLLSDDFNRRKSPIKAYEYALGGAAVVGSPTQYRTALQGRGIVARTEDEWYEGIKTYIVDADRRTRDAKALRSYVETLDAHRHTHSIYQAYQNLYRKAKCQTRPTPAPHLTGRERTRAQARAG
jgi:O-antigen biosynthesis protein